MKTIIRYSGSTIKSPKMVEGLIVTLRPLVKRGWCVCIVLEKPPENRDWIERLTKENFTLEYMRRQRRSFDLGLAFQVYKLCKRYNCDIFHAENIHTSPLIGAYLARVPTRIWTKHGMNSSTALLKKPSLKDKIVISIRTTVALSTKVIAVSEKVKNELIKLKIGRKKILVVNNPQNRNISKVISKVDAKKHFGLSQKDFVIVTIGHAVPVKGWDILINAFVQVYRKNQNVKLLLVGSHTDPHEQRTFAEVKKVIDKNNLSNKIVFTGYMYDIVLPLAAGDVFVLSSRAEGFANALLEGMDAGLPCISTKVGIAEKVINNGVNGYLVDVNSPNQLAEKINLLANNQDLYEALRNNAKIPDFILTQKQHALEMADIYENLSNKV
jgi:glycosyltransferase involved in cell wall biosynthesis